MQGIRYDLLFVLTTYVEFVILQEVFYRLVRLLLSWAIALGLVQCLVP